MSAPDALARLFGPGARRLWARFFFGRALGMIYASVFYSLAFQIHGLIGPRGILPAREYLDAVAGEHGLARFWAAPTLLWLGAGDGALTALVAAGLVASLLLAFNVWPRAAAAACGILFLSFIAAAQDFASYQSDGMLLEATLLSLFFLPRGARPGLGASDPPSLASVLLLGWEWLRIYFESGVVKLASGDRGWRELTALDRYYENGPLPTWLGWWVQQLPHGVHAACALAVLVIELGVVWLALAPRRFRLACFAIVSSLQLTIILTANYAFLNYLVLALGLMLLDDDFFARRGWPLPPVEPRPIARWRLRLAAAVLGWIAYATVAGFFVGGEGLVGAPVRALEPFRVASSYGLFAVMTPARYEIELQGSRDGQNWIAYPLRYKPQDPRSAPGVFAPYQPRFEWNLWFASLGDCADSPWVERALERLAEGSPPVLRLFASDPFAGAPPAHVRAVLWQYWFTDPATRRATGAWWRREPRGDFCP
ncbi:MAG TPA: lipase maturation factor family protein [Polyangia bacterium]|nr:lipase maturation factor family protein [Polyangia bacterium]